MKSRCSAHVHNPSLGTEGKEETYGRCNSCCVNLVLAGLLESSRCLVAKGVGLSGKGTMYQGEAEVPTGAGPPLIRSRQEAGRSSEGCWPTLQTSVGSVRSVLHWGYPAGGPSGIYGRVKVLGVSTCERSRGIAKRLPGKLDVTPVGIWSCVTNGFLVTGATLVWVLRWGLERHLVASIGANWAGWWWANLCAGPFLSCSPYRGFLGGKPPPYSRVGGGPEVSVHGPF